MATPTTQERNVKIAHTVFVNSFLKLIDDLKTHRYKAESAGFGQYAKDADSAMILTVKALNAFRKNESLLK